LEWHQNKGVDKMPSMKLGVQPHVEKIVVCKCDKKYCVICMERCPRCYKLHIKRIFGL